MIGWWLADSLVEVGPLLSVIWGVIKYSSFVLFKIISDKKPWKKKIKRNHGRMTR